MTGVALAHVCSCCLFIDCLDVCKSGMCLLIRYTNISPFISREMAFCLPYLAMFGSLIPLGCRISLIH